jgi:ribosomal protein S18 acetylase RimI-like enzyme
MAVISIPTHASQHIRRLDVRKDLPAVADLIESCFANTMDADGWVYLRQLRRAAREAAWLDWIPGATEVPVISLSGFVWVEDGTLVGNLSLIPLVKNHRRVYLIANVAVHPDFRRRGIARALTEAALQEIRQKNGPEAWLQVRQENTGAYQLYHSLGFEERAVRSSWLAQPGDRETSEPNVGALFIGNRQYADWYWQQRWLEVDYPPEVAWNLPIRLADFEPGLMNSFDRWMSGKRIRHWAARGSTELAGVLTWESALGASDHLWLAAKPGLEADIVQLLAPRALKELPRRRPVTLNYPTGKAEHALRAAGFNVQQVLIWMQAF